MATKEVTFVSKYTRLELLRRAKREVPVPDGSGGWITQQERVAYQFVPSLDRESGKLVGELKVREGQDKLSSDHSRWLQPGEEFGVERDAVAALLAHHSFGQDFWLLGHDPGTVYPRPQDWRANIRKASVRLDEEALVDMIAEEKRSHGRGDLLAEAEDALREVRQARAELEAEQAALDAAKPAAKAKPKAPAAA